jgi:hypothetical protein
VVARRVPAAGGRELTHGRVPPQPLSGGRGDRVVEVGPGDWPAPPMEVAFVAAAVDEGRALAGRAARAGAGRVLLRAHDVADLDGWRRLGQWLDGPRGGDVPAGPLSAVRRLGDGQLAVLMGVVLGAGEQGMACTCEDVTARVAGRLAIELEPELAGRVDVGS